MAHNKLYRNFIILQEDEKSRTSSGDKALSGYAKIEAKGDKCKISFYAQNLKKEDKYSMVLICYKKDIKQVVDLGSLDVNEVGKGESCKEYYVNNIAGLDLTYEKVSGAAICNHKAEGLNFLMYGFMNGENISDNWKNCKVVRHDEKYESVVKERLEIKKPRGTKEEITEVDDKTTIEENRDKKKKECKVCEEYNKDEKKLEKKKDHDEKHKCGCHDEEKDEHHSSKDKCESHKEKEDDYHTSNDNCEHHKEKEDDDYNSKDKCGSHKEKNDDHEYEYKGCEDRLNTTSFDEYESRIEEEIEVDPYDFRIKGEVGQYFEGIAEGFEEVKYGFRDIKYCKWYKVKVNNIDDMCNISNYNRYTIAYYPMINYYPYIKKYGDFMLGYKCDEKGELKYMVYAVPGKKDVDEQPYAGKTGFVTWMSGENEKVGYWLMFYDYKNSTIVVPMK